MSRRDWVLLWWILLWLSVLMLMGMAFAITPAKADPAPVMPPPVINGGAESLPGAGNTLGGEPGGGGGPNLPNISPGALAALFLCPGVGMAVNVLGGGGGYCDYSFTREGHIHCEWGGFSPIANAWQCWRVFPGQPDHPSHLDPDIIPDGWGVPWAILGPYPGDQWPPPGLAPASAFQGPNPPEAPPPPPPALGLPPPQLPPEIPERRQPGGIEFPEEGPPLPPGPPGPPQRPLLPTLPDQTPPGPNIAGR